MSTSLDDTALTPLAPAAIDAFIARWRGTDGTKRTNFQLFLTELCACSSCAGG